MENLGSLKKLQTCKTRGPAESLPAGGKVVRVHINLFPRHVDMEEELARDYRISVSKLHRRLLEREYKHRDLGKIRDAVLQNDLYSPHPGLDPIEPET